MKSSDVNTQRKAAYKTYCAAVLRRLQISRGSSYQRNVTERRRWDAVLSARRDYLAACGLVLVNAGANAAEAGRLAEVFADATERYIIANAAERRAFRADLAAHNLDNAGRAAARRAYEDAAEAAQIAADAMATAKRAAVQAMAATMAPAGPLATIIKESAGRQWRQRMDSIMNKSKNIPMFPHGVQVQAGRQPLKYGNLKLPDSTAVFSLPPVQTCGRHCAGCYAMKSQRQYWETRIYRAEMLALSRRPEFPALVIRQILDRIAAGAAGRLKLSNMLRAVRVHESGDFYSVEYVRKWIAIASYFQDVAPRLQFYAYTKRFDHAPKNRRIAAALRDLAALPNFTLVDSLQYGGLCNYGTAEELAPALAAGAFLCPCTSGDGAKICGSTAAGGCNYCQSKKAEEFAPVFHKH